MGTWAAWAPAIITLISVVFLAGQITGRIKDQEDTLKNHNDRLNDHDGRLGDLDVAVAKAESWREGYNAGKGSAQ